MTNLFSPAICLLISFTILLSLRSIKRSFKVLRVPKGSLERELSFIALMIASSDKDPILLLYSLKDSRFPLFSKEVERWQRLRALGYGPIEAIIKSAKTHPSTVFQEFVNLCLNVHKGLASRESILDFILSKYEQRIVHLETVLPSIISLLPTLIITVPAIIVPTAILANINPIKILFLTTITSVVAIILGISILQWMSFILNPEIHFWDHTLLLLLIPLLLSIAIAPKLDLFTALMLLPISSIPISLYIWYKSKDISLSIDEWITLLRRSVEHSKLTGVPLAVALVRTSHNFLARSKSLLKFKLFADLSLNEALLRSMDIVNSAFLRNLLEATRLLLLSSYESSPLEKFIMHLDKVLKLTKDIKERLKALRPTLLISLIIYSCILYLSITTLKAMSSAIQGGFSGVEASAIIIRNFSSSSIEQLEKCCLLCILISSSSLSLVDALTEDFSPWAFFKYFPAYSLIALLTYLILNTFMSLGGI